MSRVTCEVSRVTCHSSHVTFPIFYIFWGDKVVNLLPFLLVGDKVVELLGGGSVIIGAYPSSFFWLWSNPLFPILMSTREIGLLVIFLWRREKIDGLGPVDTRPSTKTFNTLAKTNYMWHLTFDTWHMAPAHYNWHVTRDTWHLTPDMGHFVGGEHSVKISASYLFRIGRERDLKIWRKRISQSVN